MLHGEMMIVVRRFATGKNGIFHFSALKWKHFSRFGDLAGRSASFQGAAPPAASRPGLSGAAGPPVLYRDQNRRAFVAELRRRASAEAARNRYRYFIVGTAAISP
jgi:hypothetical protein